MSGDHGIVNEQVRSTLNKASIEARGVVPVVEALLAQAGRGETPSPDDFDGITAAVNRLQALVDIARELAAKADNA